MDLPIKFPNDADVIAEDTARFRALSAEGKVFALADSFRDYCYLLKSSGREAQLGRFAEDEELRGRTAVEEFVIRHG